MTGPVVVGIDGSPAGTTAAWWAAREAATRGRPLLLLHSWSTQPLDVPVARETLGKQRSGGRLLQRTETELRSRYPGLTLTTELTSTPAAEALLDLGGLAELLDLGGLAELLVLGSRGHGSTASFLLGSTSLYVLGGHGVRPSWSGPAIRRSRTVRAVPWRRTAARSSSA
ncbi:universal stress protein [Streptomyces sp. NPDC085900]|uniref:universal stress protein n=1 Tax=Streptomyces sp. NPDC085900 TaxID=3365737 RepID=UPI0037D8F984